MNIKWNTLKAIEKQNELIEKQLNLQHSSLEVQQDIRALMWLLADNSGQLQGYGWGEVLDGKQSRSYRGKANFLSIVSDSITEFLKFGKMNSEFSLKKEYDRKRSKEDVVLSFWSKSFLDRGEVADDADFIFYNGNLTYRDLMIVLKDEHGYPKNTSRCSSRLETEIRKYLRSNPKKKELFRPFLDEANRGRSHYEKIVLDQNAFYVILGFLKS